MLIKDVAEQEKSRCLLKGIKRKAYICFFKIKTRTVQTAGAQPNLKIR